MSVEFEESVSRVSVEFEESVSCEVLSLKRVLSFKRAYRNSVSVEFEESVSREVLSLKRVLSFKRAYREVLVLESVRVRRSESFEERNINWSNES